MQPSAFHDEARWDFDGVTDLATFERENEAFYSNVDVMTQWRRLWQLTVQGSTHDELLGEAPRIA